MATPPCCPAGSHGPPVVDEGHTPSGKWQEFAGVDAYLVGERANARCIIMAFSDVFGPKSGRHVRVCDEIAAAVPGSLVCMPDLFHGHPICGIYASQLTMGIFGLLPMVHRIRYRCGWGNVWPEIEKVLDALQKDCEPSTPAFSFGFCWGAWASFKCSTTGRFAGGVGFHPSLRVNGIQRGPHGDNDETMADKITCPLLLLPAGNDEDSLKPGGVFFRKVHERHPQSRSIEYKEMLHGWVSRGTEPDAVLSQQASSSSVVEAQTTAKNEAASFLSELLASSQSAREG
eukprot:TRINITY_DN115799_c0_g1_i1.p1 TRINITY_DN115799_c0_g1~~TRINITY_DN115799_c0_g1_i1.p1  ORF type:complete len:287 (-),score=23.54 TRINITY_DN115799_c0_g1_i1:258-1118(-)